MRRLLFPSLAVLGLLFAVLFSTEVFARCRCDGAGRGGSRREARQERRAARRGSSCQSVAVTYQTQSQSGPYGDRVQEVGRSACPGGNCVNGYCYPPSAAIKPIPDPMFSVVIKNLPQVEKKTETTPVVKSEPLVEPELTPSAFEDTPAPPVEEVARVVVQEDE